VNAQLLKPMLRAVFKQWLNKSIKSPFVKCAI